MKLLSVVVPSYNSQAYLKNCIESLLAGGDRMEIIIVIMSSGIVFSI